MVAKSDLRVFFDVCNDSKSRIEVGKLATLAFSLTDATIRNRESKWGKLTIQALIGDKKSGLPIISAEQRS
jgi:hypothetical protein